MSNQLFLLQDISETRSSLISSATTNTAIDPSYIKAFSYNMQGPDPNHPKSRLESTILFQIVDIRNVYKSGVAYVDELRSLVDINEGFVDRQKGKQPKRGVINSVNVELESEQNESDVNVTGKKLYKLVLQDAFKNLCFAFESEDLNFLRRNDDLYPIKLGSKLIIKEGAEIVLNTFMLTNKNVEFLGGEIAKMNFKLHKRMFDRYKLEVGI